MTDGAPAIALAVEKTEAEVMKEGPRKTDEPILVPLLLVGMVIHNIILTALNLVIYIVGLKWFVGTADRSFYTETSNIESDEVMDQIAQAQTMSILFIVFAELLRSYTSRSLRNSVLSIGLFSNMYSFYTAFFSIGITCLIYAIPGLNNALGFVYIDGRAWGLVLGLCPIPAICDELLKIVWRKTNFGAREKVVRYESGLPQIGSNPRDGFVRLSQ
jgi:Ca2+-transporting ATPase